jgi:hypothetical protein
MVFLDERLLEGSQWFRASGILKLIWKTMCDDLGRTLTGDSFLEGVGTCIPLRLLLMRIFVS